MDQPSIPEKKPAVLKLKAGTYYWCACGHSKKQPMCDGSHKGTGFSPLKLDITEEATLPLCQCKHTKIPPRCDGSHKNI